MDTPRSKSHLNSHRGVRVVGKVRPSLDSEANTACSTSSSQISVSRSEGEHATIAFGDQANGRKDSCKLDWCYGQDEGASEVFSKEVKPLLQEILKGCNGCVVAYGARESGKTQLIQGSDENPGMALMAVSEILPTVEGLGGSVTISCYEVRQDRVYDLLEPKEHEVYVMEDANRRIQLKGLSQVPIKSISDFKRDYFHGCNERKASIRSHIGLIMHVSYVDKESNYPCVGKINFVDLAGYEDTKRKSLAKPSLAEIAKVNKSLYSLLNVICSLNSSDTYIPYRETKLTHLLQDFLCRTSTAVLFTCLNPTPCQDTIYVACLASRSSQVVNKHRHDSAKGCKSASRVFPPCSPNNERIRALDASVKKLDISQPSLIEKKDYGSLSLTKKSTPQPLRSSQKNLGTFLHGSTEKKVGQLSSTTKTSTPQPLRSSQKKLGTFLHGSTEKKVGQISSTTKTSVRKKLNLKSPTINSEKGISVSDNPKDTQSSTLEVNIHVADEHNLLEASDTGSPISNENIHVADEHHLLEATDTGSPISKENVPVVNDHNILKATDIGSPISKEDVLAPNEQNDIKEHNDDTKNQKQTPISDACGTSPSITERLMEISNALRLASSRSISVSTPQDLSCTRQVTLDAGEPKTPRAPVNFRLDGDSRYEDIGTPQDILKARSTGLKKSLVEECLAFLNSANKEELKKLKGIGEKRAAYIMESREVTPEPFKKIDDIKELGLSAKQIKGMMSQLLGEF